jgi:hypothetical protein
MMRNFFNIHVHLRPSAVHFFNFPIPMSEV